MARGAPRRRGGYPRYLSPSGRGALRCQVRALVDLLPDITVIEGDNFNSDPSDPSLMGPEAREAYGKGAAPRTASRRIPMIEVPLGATEDRICGTIDIERALSEGVKAFEPGLLAKANRGILFVDEVNLLDDSLVDVVLDSAASGWNTVRVRARRRVLQAGGG